jgi:hypothetical protein
MANPPINLSNWGADKLRDDKLWVFGVEHGKLVGFYHSCSILYSCAIPQTPARNPEVGANSPPYMLKNSSC